MKKTLLTLAMALVTMTGFAQENLAQEKTAIATTGNAAAAVDNNLNSRWESSTADDQSWQVDLGESLEFNVIQIDWEPAYAKNYEILAGDEVDGDGWLVDGTVIASGENSGIANHSVQTIKLDEAVKARYIKYHAIDRATQWGNSFYEFRVFNHTESVLSSLKIDASASLGKVGTAINFSATAFDQIGMEMEAGEVTYSCEPEDAGEFENNVLTVLKPGIITVTANAGEVVSNAVEVKAYNGDKIRLSSDMVTEVFGDAPRENDMANAFDNNIETQWVISENVEGANNNYTAGFTLDLGKAYNITAVSVRFEGACPADYNISFAGEDGEARTPAAFTVTNHPGMATFTTLHIAADAKSELASSRYVTFTSTKAATGYGIKIKDFSLFAELPEVVKLEAEVLDEQSVKLIMAGTDAGEQNLVYTIAYKGHEISTEPVASGEEIEQVIDNLKPGTTYTFTVTAVNENGIESAPVTVKAMTEGEPDPNLWVNADISPIVYFAPDWKESQNYTFNVDGTDATIFAGDATYNNDGPWQAQFYFLSDINTTFKENYDFGATLTSDKDLKVTLKLYQRPEDGGSNDVSYFSEDILLRAGVPYTLPKSETFIKMKGKNMNNLCLLVAIGGNPANTTLTLSGITFKVNDGEEPEVVEPFDYDTSCNLFRDATVKNAFYYSHGPEWKEYTDLPKVTVDNGTYSYVLKQATDYQWQAQAFFITDIETFSQEKYDFSVTLAASENVNATLKLYTRKEEGGNDDISLFNQDLSLSAGMKKVVRAEGLKGINLKNLCLLIDTGGNPANTTITLDKPVLKEADCTPTAISSVKVSSNADVDAPAYNIAGQRVGKAYKGIVIVNGKKIVR